MTPQLEFTLKMLGTLIIAGIAWVFMVRAQRKKQEEADQQFEWTMKAIELRNKKIGENGTGKITIPDA